MYLSRAQGGILGLSIAKVIQLADINTRITKSNHPYKEMCTYSNRDYLKNLWGCILVYNIQNEILLIITRPNVLRTINCLIRSPNCAWQWVAPDFSQSILHALTIWLWRGAWTRFEHVTYLTTKFYFLVAG